MSGAAAQQAVEMLDAFVSVGAERFDLTFTDAAGERVGFHGNCRLGELHAVLPAILDDSTKRQCNVILRPRSTGAALIQLDDLGEAAVERLRPVSFLVLRTSPGSYQAWVAVADANADFARRLRKGAGADPAASGATRVSGSINFKEKYAPAFPRIETVHASSGMLVTRVELEALGVVAPPEKTIPAPVRSALRRPGARGWPSYQRCLDNAPPARNGDRPDISRADFTFCLLALDWGWGVEETAARLMQESNKAQKNGKAYARRTVQSAAAAIERRGGALTARGLTERPTRANLPSINSKEADMPDEQPTETPAAAEPAAEEAKPVKARKPRAPRKRKPKEEMVEAEMVAAPATERPPAQAAQAILPPIAPPVIEQPREAQPPVVPAAPTADMKASQINGKPVAPNLAGAKPRKSGRRAWEINLKGDGQTWERVTTLQNEQVFRFKDQPSDAQMDLIGKYGFKWDQEHKEASRANDLEGRVAADKLSWYLKQAERNREAALTARA